MLALPLLAATILGQHALAPPGNRTKQRRRSWCDHVLARWPLAQAAAHCTSGRWSALYITHNVNEHQLRTYDAILPLIEDDRCLLQDVVVCNVHYAHPCVAVLLLRRHLEGKRGSSRARRPRVSRLVCRRHLRALNRYSAKEASPPKTAIFVCAGLSLLSFQPLALFACLSIAEAGIHSKHTKCWSCKESFLCPHGLEKV